MQNILKIEINSLNQLKFHYIKLFKNGGFYFVSDQSYELGIKVFLLIILNFAQFNEKIALEGTVTWIDPSPKNGVGIHFLGDKISLNVKIKIEETLGELLNSDDIISAI